MGEKNDKECEWLFIECKSLSEVLSAAEAAKRLGIARQTLRRWNLPTIRIGKKMYYEENLIEKILTEGK